MSDLFILAKKIKTLLDRNEHVLCRDFNFYKSAETRSWQWMIANEMHALILHRSALQIPNTEGV